MFDSLSDKLSRAFQVIAKKHKITEENIEETLGEIKNALLSADVNYKVVKDFIASVKEKALGANVLTRVNPSEQFIKIFSDELVAILGGEARPLELEGKSLVAIMVVGLNGQGKTTFSAKLASFLKEKKKEDVLLVPLDTTRPAAKDQLKILADSIKVDLYDSDLDMAPEEITKEALSFAKSRSKKVLILDTAGRLHVASELMDELLRIKNTLAALPSETLLVADAMTGQEALQVALSFHEKITLTGVVLSKMDSDAKGGAALSISHSTGLPIRFISTGERIKDLEIFYPDRMASRILDMGDIVSFVEKAQEEISEKEAEDAWKRLKKGQFTLDDFVKQLGMLSRLGNMGSLLKMIPGMGESIRQMGDLSRLDFELKKIKVMISSMTKEEKNDCKMISSTRIERIAKGSGTSRGDVETFLAKFSQMEKMMAGLGSMGPASFLNMGPTMKGFRQKGKGDFAMPSMQKEKKVSKGPWGKKYF